MRIIIYSIMKFELSYLLKANKLMHELALLERPLNENTVELAMGFDAVVVFTSDVVSAAVIEKLHSIGVKYIAIRAAGYDNIDIKKAQELGIAVANVPQYSPNAIAEHTVALILAISRKLVFAEKQVKDHNFSLDNLVGFNLNGKTVGIIGTGRIGSIVASILNGFGCRLIAYDVNRNDKLAQDFNLKYVDMNTLLENSDIISLHIPLNASTRYLINKDTIALMKRGVMLINTARGAVMNTLDVIEGLRSGKIGYLGTDVYENEKGIFFHDHSKSKIQDRLLETLMSFPNVTITPHQGFATEEALSNIAGTTLYNLDCWSKGISSENELQ